MILKKNRTSRNTRKNDSYVQCWSKSINGNMFCQVFENIDSQF